MGDSSLWKDIVQGFGPRDESDWLRVLLKISVEPHDERESHSPWTEFRKTATYAGM